MSNPVSHIPNGLAPVVPQLVINGAQEAIGFLQKALGAELLHSMPGPGGGVMHAAVRIEHELGIDVAGASAA